ncbi:MAG: transcription antitermination factor NusB [Nitrospinae bacterium CG11_big_fil_rev_8_21_14_0_20_56_8]|nr:MAG: transcription antitermination factor NusB [Nitrospinae bacterium CG11_big_fil_rev_8_21_14_0_20_56_8]
MGKRRSSRELALRFLYQAEFNPEDLDEQLEEFLDRTGAMDEIKTFTRDLVYNVVRRKAEIDALIQKFSDNWSLDRMTVIDRNILRLGTSELLYCSNIPPKVAINEAVEIAKKYGSADSPDFINGVLDQVFKSSPKKQAQPSV